DADHLAHLHGTLAVSMQGEAQNLPVRAGRFQVRCLEGNAAGQQGLQRLALNLDTGQPALEGDAAGIPEPCGRIHQVHVIRLDMHPQNDLTVVTTELVTLHRAYLDLLVQHRTTNLDGAKLIGKQHQVQARRAQVQRWRLAACDEAARWRLALLTWLHGNVVALHQRLETRDPRQRNGRLDHPELRTLDQILF